MSRFREWAADEQKKIAEIPGFRKKASYIWEYYKLWIIGFVCFVWLAAFSVRQYTATLHDYWCYIIFNNTYADVATDSEIWKDFVEYADLDLGEKEVEFNARSYFDYLKGVTGNTYFEAFVTYADSGVLDGITMNKASLVALGKTGRLMDLNSEACSSIKAKYEDRFIYTEPYNEEYSDDPVPVGIDISDSRLVSEYKAYPDDCALGIGALSSNVDTMERFLDFILDGK